MGKESFGMTATLESPETIYAAEKNEHPSAKYFISTLNNPKYDGWICQQECQTHNCNLYCLRKRKYFANDESKESKKGGFVKLHS